MLRRAAVPKGTPVRRHSERGPYVCRLWTVAYCPEHEYPDGDHGAQFHYEEIMDGLKYSAWPAGMKFVHPDGRCLVVQACEWGFRLAEAAHA